VDGKWRGRGRGRGEGDGEEGVGRGMVVGRRGRGMWWWWRRYTGSRGEGGDGMGLAALGRARGGEQGSLARARRRVYFSSRGHQMLRIEHLTKLTEFCDYYYHHLL